MYFGSNKPARSLKASKLLCILVPEDSLTGVKEKEQWPCHCSTWCLLQSTIQLVGCKARLATKINGLLKNHFKSTNLSLHILNLKLASKNPSQKRTQNEMFMHISIQNFCTRSSEMVKSLIVNQVIVVSISPHEAPALIETNTKKRRNSIIL